MNPEPGASQPHTRGRWGGPNFYGDALRPASYDVGTPKEGATTTRKPPSGRSDLLGPKLRQQLADKRTGVLRIYAC